MYNPNCKCITCLYAKVMLEHGISKQDLRYYLNWDSKKHIPPTKETKMKIERTGNDTIFVTSANGHCGMAMSRHDLEEGLRVLNEKPVFTGYDSNGTKFLFQKHSDSIVRYTIPDCGWCMWVTSFFDSRNGVFNTPSIHRAIADALES